MHRLAHITNISLRSVEPSSSCLLSCMVAELPSTVSVSCPKLLGTLLSSTIVPQILRMSAICLSPVCFCSAYLFLWCTCCPLSYSISAVASEINPKSHLFVISLPVCPFQFFMILTSMLHLRRHQLHLLVSVQSVLNGADSVKSSKTRVSWPWRRSTKRANWERVRAWPKKRIQSHDT